MRKSVASLVLIGFVTQPFLSAAACNIIGGKAYGDCSGINVRSGEKQTLNVRSSIEESAIVAGATVHKGGSLYLSGISNGDILVKSGGRLTVSGVVNGAVRNEGGYVEIEGIVNHLDSSGGKAIVGGQVDSFSGNGPVQFKKGSVFQGQPLTRSENLPKHQ